MHQGTGSTFLQQYSLFCIRHVHSVTVLWQMKVLFWDAAKKVSPLLFRSYIPAEFLYGRLL